MSSSIEFVVNVEKVERVGTITAGGKVIQMPSQFDIAEMLGWEDRWSRNKRTETGDMFKIDHLGMAVRSIREAKMFYELMGMRVTHEETVEHEQVRTAMIPVGESQIELLEPISEESVVGRFIDRRGEGLHHVAFQVDDIAATFEEMKAAGMRLVSDDLKIGAGGHLYFFVHPSSTGGVLVEICQDVPAEG